MPKGIENKRENIRIKTKKGISINRFVKEGEKEIFIFL